MKDFNNVDMKGRLYTYALDTLDTDKGEAIAGTVTLEVDEDGSTAEARFFAYPTYSSGKPNKTYGVLEDIMAGKYQTVVDDGDDADWLAFTGTIDISYFTPKDGALTTEELARAQKIRGAFLNPNKKHEYNNKWKADLYITKVDDVDADEEKGYDRFVRVSGYIVDSYNERVNFMVCEARKAAAMNYIIGLPVSAETPYPVSTWGEFSTMVTKSIKKNAFGEDEVREFDVKKWVITGMDPEPYTFGDESVMTVEQWNEYKANLEKYKETQLEGPDGDKGGSKPKLSF